MPHAEYDKYEKDGDIHWQWYAGHADYHFLVEDSLAPFKNAELGTLVDVGCGDGLPLSLLHELGFKCAGVDSSEVGVKMALNHNVSAEYFIEKAEKFAERDLPFDYLYSLNTIEHLDDPVCMLRIMSNIRKFGVIITDNDENVDPAKKSPYHETQFTPESFKTLFEAGFNLEPIAVRDPRWMGFKIWKKQ